MKFLEIFPIVIPILFLLIYAGGYYAVKEDRDKLEIQIVVLKELISQCK